MRKEKRFFVPKERIIHFNPSFVYFWDKGQVVRCRRCFSHGMKEVSVSRESRSNLKAKQPCKIIKETPNIGNPKTINALRLAGVRILSQHEYLKKLKAIEEVR